MSVSKQALENDVSSLPLLVMCIFFSLKRGSRALYSSLKAQHIRERPCSLRKQGNSSSRIIDWPDSQARLNLAILCADELQEHGTLENICIY